MALIKSKDGNSVYTWKSDDIRDAEISALNSAIEAMVNVNGCCNVFAIDNPISLSDMEVSNNELINTNTDTLDFFNFMFRAYVNGSYGNIDPLAHEYIAADGNYSYTVLIPSNATKLQFKHNGANHDLSIEIPIVPAGTYKLTFTVNGYNPSTVGGLEISNIMLYDARLTPSGYIPYAMTNRELTEMFPKRPKRLVGIYGAIYQHGYGLFIPYDSRLYGTITPDMVHSIEIAWLSGYYRQNIRIDTHQNMLAVMADDLPADPQYIGDFAAVNLF